MKRKVIDLKGFKFGRLTVIERAGNDKYGSVLWKCVCDCGKEVTISSPRLRSGNTTSCGCKRLERIRQANTTHGMTKTSIHRCWNSMLTRCFNSNSKSWKNYGARGINVASQWLDFSTFFRYVGPKPGPKYTLDRVNNEGNYEPGNVKWRTYMEQASNRRSNRYLEWNNERRTVTQWAEHMSLMPYVIYQRLDKLKWSVDKALTTPCRKIRAN